MLQDDPPNDSVMASRQCCSGTAAKSDGASGYGSDAWDARGASRTALPKLEKSRALCCRRASATSAGAAGAV